MRKDSELTGFVRKITTLDNVRQWEERDSVVKETVSQHSFKVSAICIYILEKITDDNWDRLGGNNYWSSFRYEAVKYATLHDFDEAILCRDISHEIKYNKYNGGVIRVALDNFVKHEIDESGLSFIYGEVWANVKDLVKMCDWLALLTFITRNEKMGVKEFSEEKKYCLDNFSDSVVTVKATIDRTFKDCDLDLDFFNDLIKCVYEW